MTRTLISREITLFFFFFIFPLISFIIREICHGTHIASIEKRALVYIDVTRIRVPKVSKKSVVREFGIRGLISRALRIERSFLFSLLVFNNRQLANENLHIDDNTR